MEHVSVCETLPEEIKQRVASYATTPSVLKKNVILSLRLVKFYQVSFNL
jgi:hypothetical protein